MRVPLVLLTALVLAACQKPEPIQRADYFVQNTTTFALRIEHTPSFNLDAPLLTDTVLPGARVHILSVSEGSGGHAMPSTFFSTFSLLAVDSVIYSGVRNSDWLREGEVDGRLQLVLVID